MKSILKQYHYLYKITNNINNKIYIGIHSTNNLDDGYLGSGKSLIKSIKKYGKENFIKEILEWFDWRCEALQRESEIVNTEFIKRNDVYNNICGGFGCNYWSYKSRLKLSLTKIGHFSHNKGKTLKPHTEETKEQMRKNHFNSFGPNNPRARKCSVLGRIYKCAKDAYNDLKPDINYENFCRRLRLNKDSECFYI